MRTKKETSLPGFNPGFIFLKVWPFNPFDVALPWLLRGQRESKGYTPARYRETPSLFDAVFPWLLGGQRESKGYTSARCQETPSPLMLHYKWLIGGQRESKGYTPARYRETPPAKKVAGKKPEVYKS